MKKYLLTIICVISCLDFVLSQDDIVSLLTNVVKRLENIDQSYVIDMIHSQVGKPDVHRKFLTRIGWSDGKVRQAIRIDYLLPSEMEGVVFWEHRLDDKSKRRWRTLPVTGKLKELKKSEEKNMQKTGFDFSELELTPHMIETSNYKLLGPDSLNSRQMIVIEVEDTLARERDRKTKQLWIDPERKIIMKVTILDRHDRKIKTATCTKVEEVDGKFVYSTIEVKERKKNQSILINLSDYSFSRISDPRIFIPSDQ